MSKAPTLAKELISHSRMVAFRACRRKHDYAYEKGIRPVKQAMPLVFGDAAHRWLEAWSLRGQQWICPVAPPGVLHEDRSEADMLELRSIEQAFEIVEARDPFEAAKLRAMVLGYHLRWSAVRWIPKEVEREFRAPLVNPLDGQISKRYERGGKIDMITEIPGTDPEWVGEWVVEHKTSGMDASVGTVYHQKLRMDPQCTEYILGASSLGYPVRGVIYDVLVKPAIEPRKATPEEGRKMTIGMGCKLCKGASGKRGNGCHPADIIMDADDPTRRPCAACSGTGWKEAPRWHANVRLHDETPGEYGMRCFEAILAEPTYYYVRHKVTRLDHEIEEHRIDTWYGVRSMHEQRETGVAPRNPDHCFAFYRQCDYYPVCTHSASITDDRLYQITKKHPELNNENEG